MLSCVAGMWVWGGVLSPHLGFPTESQDTPTFRRTAWPGGRCVACPASCRRVALPRVPATAAQAMEGSP